METLTRPARRSRPAHRIRGRLDAPLSVYRDESPGFDRDYWLAHCEGYRVDAADGRLGFVDHVRPDGSDGTPTLAVRAGLLGRRLLLVPASAVAFIVPRAEQIWLHSPVSIAGTEPASG